MNSRTEDENGSDVVGKDIPLQRKRFDKSYGAMTMIMGYLPRLESLKLQGLDTWWYNTGVCRVQVHFLLPKLLSYFGAADAQIVAISDSGECERFDLKG